MAVRLGDIARDLQAEREGQWMDSRLFEGVRYKVKSLNDPAYRRAQAEYEQRRRRRFMGAPADPEWVDREFGKLVADRLLVSWKGIEPEHDPETARQVLTDPRYRDIADDIVNLAAKVGEPQMVSTEGTE